MGKHFEAALEQDWPDISGPSEAAWTIARGNLENAHEKPRGGIAVFDPERRDGRVPGRRYSICFLPHAVIRHNRYPAGQIAILKKA